MYVDHPTPGGDPATRLAAIETPAFPAALVE